VSFWYSRTDCVKRIAEGQSPNTSVVQSMHISITPSTLQWMDIRVKHKNDDSDFADAHPNQIANARIAGLSMEITFLTQTHLGLLMKVHDIAR
jgi:hypothetical protein